VLETPEGVGISAARDLVQGGISTSMRARVFEDVDVAMDGP
jgi:hypothetical protein